LQDGLVSFEFAQGLAILRTLPGYASSIASALDSMNIVEIAGTIAGDDTILIIPRDGATREAVIEQLSAVMPGI
ncbi:MAG TPA: arginine repressor, partial [Bacteroidales bacterium]|nr:arginine repressor [Bacteroidales bacterium]